MVIRHRLALTLTPLTFAALLVGCGGRTLAGNGTGTDTGAGTGADAGSRGGTTGTDSGTGSGPTTGPNGCVEVDVPAYGQTCKTAADCTVIPTGTICPSQCYCRGTGTAINNAAYAVIMAGPAAEAWDTCHCAVQSVVLCVAGQCALCDSSADAPPECGDAGLGEDGGVDDDGGFDDGGVIIGPSCPEPSTVQSGGACSPVGTECTGTYRLCNGATSNAPCTCDTAGWICPGVACGDDAGPPTSACAVGATCAQGETCTMPGAGPCDSDVRLFCADTDQGEGAYAVQSFPCSSTSGSCGWGDTGNGCSESCSCQNGSMVCTGDCPDGGLASP